MGNGKKCRRRPSRRRTIRTPALLVLFAGGIACSSSSSSSDDPSQSVCKDGVTRPSWWGYASHCPKLEPNYEEVFDASRVRRLDFKIDASVFAKGQADLDSLTANAGTDDLDGMTQPIWMEATLGYDSKTWTGVAVRWKGHASLVGAWSNHIGKLSLRVAMDELEDENPQLADQRFFGFKGFTLGNAYKDDSFIRDKTAADIFRAAGVPAPRGAFAQVYIDIGNGPFYMGLYTMIEREEDHMLESQLGNDEGNLYKPWGDAARWPPIADSAVPLRTTSVAEVETHFEKQSNKETDWSDVVAAINVLHSDRSDAAAWRAKLEAVFDVPAFLKWLATNQTMLDWDAYGCMTHNYYVYANPKNGGRLMWLPWDLNEALADRKHDGCVPGSVMLDEIVSGSSSIGKEWPLIKNILGDSTYRQTYKGYLQAVLDSAFASDAVKTQMKADHDLVAPYLDGTVASENGAVKNGLFTGWYTYQTTTAADFKTSLTRTGDGASTADGLQVHVDKRRAAVAAALAAAE
jgi:spore coat protein H